MTHSSWNIFLFFFFNDTATTEIYTLSLHDALPILRRARPSLEPGRQRAAVGGRRGARSEEHTSELQSRRDLVCRLLLEKKKNQEGNQLPTGQQPNAEVNQSTRRSHHSPHPTLRR